MSGSSDELDLDALFAGAPSGDPRAPPRRAITDSDKLTAQVARCLGALVGSSGHLGSYTLTTELRLTDRRELPDGCVEWSFEAEAIYESEHTVHGEHESIATHSLRGSIVLDASFRLQLDDAGRVRLAPWRASALALGIE